MSVARQDQPISTAIVHPAPSGSPQGHLGPHLQEHDHDAHDHGFEWRDGVRIALVALAAALVWFRVWEPFAHVSIIGIAGTLIGIYPILKEAWENIGVGLAAFGLLNPLFAAFIHVVSELTFILNSARLLPRAHRKTTEIYGTSSAASTD